MNYKDGSIWYEPSDSFVSYYEKELSESENENIDTICRDHNSTELERAEKRFLQVKQTLKKIPSSGEYLNQKEYYENVIGEFLSWFEQNELQPKHPTILSSGVDIQKAKSKHSKGGRPPDPKISQRNAKIRKEYYKFTNEKGFSRKKAVEILSKEYGLTKATIETYLK
tara:strand:- start:44 stop:547 length:504 start_codon:yes stop_codon:yes gene_type:complete